MSDEAQVINVEKMVEEIKAGIVRDYTPQEILAFEPVSFSASLVYADPGSVPNEAFLEERLTACLNDRQVAWDRPIAKGPFASFVMKAMRRLMRFFIVPIVEDQNRLNIEMVDVLLQMKLLLDEQGKQIEGMAQRISTLEDELGK